MNIDNILKFFVPKDNSFVPLFEKDAQNLIMTADVLRQLMATNDPEKQDVYVAQIKELERIGDDITHTIFDQLNKSFITPFDREDIHKLASNIDDVVDAINRASQRINLYKPKSYIPEYIEIAEVLYQAAIEIKASIDNLKNASNNKNIIIQSCITINTLENKADDIYHMGISLIFENENDPLELIKKKEILETLEKAVDKAEDVSDTIKTILVKMS